MLLHALFTTTLIFSITAAPATTDCGLTMPSSWTYTNSIAQRNASSISASPWSVGAETMDRNYTFFSAWSTYLPLLGAKAARVQGGWARTEPAGDGKFEWEWLDEIVRGMHTVGVSPWLQLSYGNPAYGTSGGTQESSSPLPVGAAGAAFQRWVGALVTRYADVVSTYEVWNEPNIMHINASDMAIFTNSTLTTLVQAYGVRQPPLVTRVGTLAGIDQTYAKQLLDGLKTAGGLPLVSEISFHPYSFNPDATYAKEANLSALVEFYIGAGGKAVRIMQGENGAPSTNTSYGALSGYPWTDCSQAKWLSRRLVGDRARGVDSNIFSIADMCYLRDGHTDVNTKGLLSTNCSAPGFPVTRVKLAYAVVGRLFGLLDATFAPAPASLGHVIVSSPVGTTPIFASLFTHDVGSGPTPVVALWDPSGTPTNADNTSTTLVNVTVFWSSGGLPASGWNLFDSLTGSVFAQSSKEDGASVTAENNSVTIVDVPTSDFVALLALAPLSN